MSECVIKQNTFIKKELCGTASITSFNKTKQLISKREHHFNTLLQQLQINTVRFHVSAIFQMRINSL